MSKKSGSYLFHLRDPRDIPFLLILILKDFCRDTLSQEMSSLERPFQEMKFPEFRSPGTASQEMFCHAMRFLDLLSREMLSLEHLFQEIKFPETLFPVIKFPEIPSKV